MRSGKKLPYSHYIGGGGEGLAYFIHAMSDQEKSQLNTIVSDLFGSTIEIQTHDQGSRVEITAILKTVENTVYIDSTHISDGLLRMLALAAIALESKKQSSTDKDNEYVAEPDEAYSEKNGFPCKGIFLLDEIEDGINPYLSEQLLLLLRNIVEIEKKQVIVTTHSPVVLNDFLPEEIVFLWRDKNGFSHSRKLFDTEEMKDTLEFLNPGEVWLNLEKEDILDKLSTDKEGRE